MSVSLDDPVRQDLEDFDLQAQIIGSIERGEWHAVVAQTPCSSFSVAQEPAICTSWPSLVARQRPCLTGDSTCFSAGQYMYALQRPR